MGILSPKNLNCVGIVLNHVLVVYGVQITIWRTKYATNLHQKDAVMLRRTVEPNFTKFPSCNRYSAQISETDLDI
jgi:hypothetical protein